MQEGVIEMSYMELMLVAVAPGVALCLILYLLDRYDREPMKYLLLVFGLGCIATFPAIFFENLINRINIFSGPLRIIFASFIVIAFVEEVWKRSVVMTAVYYKPVYNEKLDGIVYCCFSALGFATIENIIYVVFRYPHIANIGFMRGIISVPAHMLYAITMGYELSLAKFAGDPKSKKRHMRNSLLYPVIMHGVFDLVLMLEIPKASYIFIPLVILLWFINMRKLVIFIRDSKVTMGHD